MIAGEHWFAHDTAFFICLCSLLFFTLPPSTTFAPVPFHLTLPPITPIFVFIPLCLSLPPHLIPPSSSFPLISSSPTPPTLPRSMIQPSIEKDLSEFQQKRLMGLGWMFGDQKLSDTMAPEEVADTVYSTLVPHIKDIM